MSEKDWDAYVAGAPDWRAMRAQVEAEYVQYMNDRLAAVIAERDALRQDAERYRWLRDDPRGRSYSVSGIEWSGDSAKADELIDALRGKAAS